MGSKTLFFRREPAKGGKGEECWFLVQQSDGTYWVEHTRETAAADEADLIETVRIGHFFANTEDVVLLRELRRALTKAVT